MLLTARRNQPTFGRRTVISTARQLFPEMPLSSPVSDVLEIGHLMYMRNFRISDRRIQVAEADRILGEVGALLAFAAEVLQ
jgi:hypothetical protein